MNPIRYFVSFIDTATGHAAGAEMRLPNPIRDMDDIEELRQALIKQGRYSPVVLGFSRFEEEK